MKRPRKGVMGSKLSKRSFRGVVWPANTQARLGTLIRDLREGAHEFEFVLANDLALSRPFSRCCSWGGRTLMGLGTCSNGGHDAVRR